MGTSTARIPSRQPIFGFPNPTNEVASRIVAGVVVLMCAAAIATRQGWLLIPIAYGFWARLLAGPKLSPASAIASKLLAPRLAAPKLVPGPPKRFAQGIGAALSSVAAIFWLIPGGHWVTWLALGMLAAAALLEAVAGFCLGCKMFGVLMRIGLVPEEVCAECADITLRLGRSGEGRSLPPS